MKNRFLTILLASIVGSCMFLFQACSKPNDPPAASIRTVKYEVTGNFSGNLIASYTTAGGGTANETINALPWTKEITYENSVTAAIIAASGNGGTAGQSITIVVKKGTTTVSTTSATASASGSFTVSSPVVRF